MAEQAADEPEGDAFQERPPLLGFAGQVITILVVGIPAIGVLIRWISLVPFEGPRLRVATSAPVAELAGTAVAAIWPMTMVALVTAAMARWVIGPGGEKRTKRPSMSSRSQAYRLFSNLQLVVVVVVVLGVILLYPSFPSNAIVALTGISLGVTVRRGISIRPLRLEHFALSALVVLVGSVGFYATRPGGADVPSASVTFVSAAGLDDGTYLDLGTSEGVQYLIPCNSNQIVGLPIDLVIRQEYLGRSVPQGPSLWEAIRGDGLEIGLSSAC